MAEADEAEVGGVVAVEGKTIETVGLVVALAVVAVTGVADLGMEADSETAEEGLGMEAAAGVAVAAVVVVMGIKIEEGEEEVGGGSLHSFACSCRSSVSINGACPVGVGSVGL